MLAVDGQLLEEIGVLGVRHVLAEPGVSILQGKQLRVVLSGISQATKGLGVVIPGKKCWGSKDRGVKRPEDRVK